jgi:hypothetical protein
MRSVCRTALAAFAVALALGAIAASSAFAAPEWYTSTSKPTPEWQQAGAKITEAAATKWKGTVTLRDAGAAAEVECTATGEGTAGPGAADKDTSWTLSSCVAPAKTLNKKGESVANACEKAIKATMNNLPWGTELFIDVSMYDENYQDGSGEPSFSMTCKTILGEVTDTCESNFSVARLTTQISNVTGGVDSTFPGAQGLYCTIGGAEEGEVRGTQLIEAAKGGKLEANAPEPTFSKVTKAQAVNGASFYPSYLTIEDKGTKTLGAACEIRTEGTITTGGKGTITSFSGGCNPVGACTKVEKAEAIGLPWETELYESGGVIRQRILSSGHGTPAWAFTCTGVERDECLLNVSPEIISRNAEENVYAVFSEALTKTTCKIGGSEKGVWKGELSIAPESGTIKAKK